MSDFGTCPTCWDEGVDLLECELCGKTVCITCAKRCIVCGVTYCSDCRNLETTHSACQNCSGEDARLVIVNRISKRGIR